MTKIAVDVVLLPSDIMMDKAIEVNKKLLESFERKIILNKENCLPHISLAMGVVDKKDISAIDKILREAAEQFSPMNLKAVNLRAETTPTGKSVSDFEIGKTEKLQLLHETIMKKCSPYFTYEPAIEMVFPSPKPKEATLYWIKNYPQNSSFENFLPHITIGFGEINNINLPIKFTGSKLALCHLGNYCTCRKILASTVLKG